MKSIPLDFAKSLAESSANRLLSELTRIDAPQPIIDLAHSLDFFALYQSDRAPDFPEALTLYLQAMIDTGGL